MGEFPKSPEWLPQVEQLRAEVDAHIAGEPDLMRRGFLHAQTLQAGDPRYLYHSGTFTTLEDLYTGNSSTFEGMDGVYGLLEQTAKGIGELYRRGYDVTDPARWLMHYAAATRGDGSDSHRMVGFTLLESGYIDPAGTLYNLVTANDFLSHDSPGPREYKTYVAQHFLQALITGHDIDVLSDSSPYKKICDKIWELQGLDPDYYGQTFYLSRAYASVGNTARAGELALKIHRDSQRCKALLKVAETCTDPTVQAALEAEAASIARTDTDRCKGLALEMAEHFALLGRADQVHEWLREPSNYGLGSQADTWAKLYLHTGDIDDRFRAVDLWHKSFNDHEGQAELVQRVAVKDLATSRLQPSLVTTQVPLMAHELVTADRGRLAWNRGRALALLAGQFASDRNTEALDVVMGPIRNSGHVDPYMTVRGLSAASVGLIAA